MTSSVDKASLHKPRFCEGSIMRHVVVMASTGAVGLMAVFGVDFLNLLYLSRLGNPDITAAIGFANIIGYLQISVCIGFSIGIVVITARLIGARQQQEAARIVTSFLCFMTLLMILIGILIAIFRDDILSMIGAKGFVLEQSSHFIMIISPCLFLIALGMVISGLLRAVGDAKRSMNVTLIGAIISAILDPLFILVFHLGIEGAAISTVCSRLGVVIFGLYSVKKYHLIQTQKLSLKQNISDSLYVLRIAFPAILTNLATPVGGLFVAKTMSQFGSNAMSGQTTIDRIIPLAFAFIFALTGSVGPIISQNLGGGYRNRMIDTLKVSFKLVCVCVLIGWVFFFCTEEWMIRIFSLEAEGIQLMHLFCQWIILGNVFLGMLFVANTAFNNLGYPLLSTLFNWGRATLGTIPFVWFGSAYGPSGVLIGQTLGVIPFGCLAIICAFIVMKKIKVGPPSF